MLGLPSSYQSVPNHMLGLPSNYQSVPNHMLGLPSSYQSVPNHMLELPSNYQSVPKHMLTQNHNVHKTQTTPAALVPTFPNTYFSLMRDKPSTFKRPSLRPHKSDQPYLPSKVAKNVTNSAHSSTTRHYAPQRTGQTEK
jgi:hypothetical protein